MNMEEFVANIWNAEESQTVDATMQEAGQAEGQDGADAEGEAPMTQQPRLSRQGSVSVILPLSKNTVEEVRSEMHREQQQQLVGGNSGNAPRQLIFEEMTLEDFLVREGVVRDSAGASAFSSQLLQQQQQYGFFRNAVEPHVGLGSVMTCGFGYPDARNTANGGVAGGIQSYQGCPAGQQGSGVSAVPAEGFSSFGRNGYGGTLGNGGGAVRHGSSDGAAPTIGVMDDSGGQFGSGMARRIVDGVALRGAERRQRRMIKNRESAARSRARKQAYTVGLEAELNQLKEENASLNKDIEELEEKQRNKILEAKKGKRTIPASERRAKILRRTSSWPR